MYCATKFAVAGLTESYAAEVRDFGVQATVVFPGYFRTAFLTAGSMGLPTQPLAVYQAVRESQVAHTEHINGQQPGDPDKGMAVLIQLSERAEQPVHLFLGEDAHELARQQMQAVTQDLEQWQAVAAATNLNPA